MGPFGLKVQSTPHESVFAPLKKAKVNDAGRKCPVEIGSKELTCGSRAFLATLLFDPSMSALPIIVLYKAQRVGLFTR